MNKTFVVKFDSRTVMLCEPNGFCVRRFSASPGKTIAAASVNNAEDDSMVTINYTDGRADIYHWTGRVYRRNI